MTFSELTRLARELESSDPYDRGLQKSSLERLRALRKRARQDCAPEVATCIGAVTQLIDALTRSQETISREQVKGIACRMLFALGNDLGELPDRPDEGPAPPAEEKTPAATVAPPRAAPAPPTPPAAPARPAAAPQRVAPALTAQEPPALMPRRSDMAFGRMLVELGHVTRDQVATALRFHRSRGPRIGECLLLTGSISPEHLLNALKIQDLLRSTPHGITPETLARYKASPEPRTPEPEAPESKAPEREPPAPTPQRPPGAAQRVTEGIFLGEVLLGADMITNEQLEKALHIHHHKGVRVGEALVQIGALTEEDVQAGIELQEQLRYIAGLQSVRMTT